MPPTKLPESYNTLKLQDIKLSHHPASSTTVTPIILVILNRPEARNAFTTAMADSAAFAFNLLSEDPRVKCVILTGSDTTNTTFCAGMDLTNPVGPDPNQTGSGDSGRDAYRDPGGRMTLAVHRCNKPVIAAINGNAVGVGITMALPANIRVVSNKARVGFVFTRRGLVLEACSSFFLPRLLGTSRAMHLVTTGAVYPSTSHLFGDLFSEVVEPDQVLPRALAIAAEVASKTSAVANKLNKEMIYRQTDSPEEAHLLESKLFYELITGRDTQEGIISFVQKREPDFQGNMQEDAPRVYPWWKETDLKPKI